jgi:hypothetical protein
MEKPIRTELMTYSELVWKRHAPKYGGMLMSVDFKWSNSKELARRAGYTVEGDIEMVGLKAWAQAERYTMEWRDADAAMWSGGRRGEGKESMAHERTKF